MDEDGFRLRRLNALVSLRFRARPAMHQAHADCEEVTVAFVLKGIRLCSRFVPKCVKPHSVRLVEFFGVRERDRGTPRGAAPPTPPGIRFRTTAVRSI